MAGCDGQSASPLATDVCLWDCVTSKSLLVSDERAYSIAQARRRNAEGPQRGMLPGPSWNSSGGRHAKGRKEDDMSNKTDHIWPVANTVEAHEVLQGICQCKNESMESQCHRDSDRVVRELLMLLHNVGAHSSALESASIKVVRAAIPIANALTTNLDLRKRLEAALKELEELKKKAADAATPCSNNGEPIVNGWDHSVIGALRERLDEMTKLASSRLDVIQSSAIELEAVKGERDAARRAVEVHTQSLESRKATIDNLRSENDSLLKKCEELKAKYYTARGDAVRALTEERDAIKVELVNTETRLFLLEKDVENKREEHLKETGALRGELSAKIVANESMLRELHELHLLIAKMRTAGSVEEVENLVNSKTQASDLRLFSSKEIDAMRRRSALWNALERAVEDSVSIGKR